MILSPVSKIISELQISEIPERIMKHSVFKKGLSWSHI
jgi:hypothetical protein